MASRARSAEMTFRKEAVPCLGGHKKEAIRPHTAVANMGKNQQRCGREL